MQQADAKEPNAPLILEADPARDELYVFLPDFQGSAEWIGTDDFRRLTLRDGSGKVIGVFVRGFNRWKKHHSALVNLIATTLRVSSDEVVEVLTPLPRRTRRRTPAKPET